MVPRQVDLRRCKVAAVLNRSSGSCDAAAEQTMMHILREAGITPVEMACVDGHEVEPALAHFAKASIDALIVLGGDGTIRTAAECCSETDILLAALPGGTMNMLPRALYGERNWQQALSDTVAAPRIAEIGGGETNGHRFFCAGIFGSPSHWAEAREALRANRLREAFARALRAYHRSFSARVHYSFGAGQVGTATAVAVICPLISKIMPSDAPALEAAALNPRDLGDAFSLVLRGMLSDWRIDANVTTCATRLLTILSRRALPALLDGEMVMLPPRSEIRFVPNAFKAMVPEGSPVLAATHEQTV